MKRMMSILGALLVTAGCVFLLGCSKSDEGTAPAGDTGAGDTGAESHEGHDM